VELVQTAQAKGMSAIGLTDHNLLTGVIEFVTACKASEIQTILGLEVRLNEDPLSLGEYLLTTRAGSKEGFALQ